jgi:replicative superfamily II helicase
MAFKKAPPPSVVPDSPEQILLGLPRRKIPGVLLHQGEMMRAYAAQAVKASDVALQLPTGSGKTLVGLMIGEWRRRKFRERVVYLCPNRQLVNQVVEQADEQYGLTVNGFTGSKSNYDPTAKSVPGAGNRHRNSAA